MSQIPPIGEKPVSEPEIIPPSRGGAEPRLHAEMWRAFDPHGVRRIYVTRLGPLGFVSLILGVTLLVALVLVLLAGALLLWIPVLILMGAGAVLGALVRRSTRPRR